MASLGNIEIFFSQVVCGGRQRQADLQRNSISKKTATKMPLLKLGKW